jgi:hypothetical protein
MSKCEMIAMLDNSKKKKKKGKGQAKPLKTNKSLLL